MSTDHVMFSVKRRGTSFNVRGITPTEVVDDEGKKRVTCSVSTSSSTSRWTDVRIGPLRPYDLVEEFSG